MKKVIKCIIQLNINKSIYIIFKDKLIHTYAI